MEINHDNTLFDIKEGLRALTGCFQRFVNANTCSSVEQENEQPFTIVRPDMSRVTNLHKRSREYSEETVSICPSHNSFVGNEEEPLSAIVSENPNKGARARSCTSDSGGIDLSSLFSEKRKANAPEDNTVPQLNMEDEIFDSINDDLLSEYDSAELGDPLKSDKVATRVAKIWSKPNIKGLNKIFKRHKQPANIKPLSTPSMPKIN